MANDQKFTLFTLLLRSYLNFDHSHRNSSDLCTESWHVSLSHRWITHLTQRQTQSFRSITTSVPREMTASQTQMNSSLKVSRLLSIISSALPPFCVRSEESCLSMSFHWWYYEFLIILNEAEIEPKVQFILNMTLLSLPLFAVLFMLSIGKWKSRCIELEWQIEWCYFLWLHY